MSRFLDLSRRAMVLLFGAALTLPCANISEARPMQRSAHAVVFEGSCDAAPPVGVSRLWLGHFTGGRYAQHVDGIRHVTNNFDWANEYRCFSTRASCDSWQRSMRRAFGRIEGYWTCLPIR